MFLKVCFDDIKERGLRGGKLIVSDGTKGYRKQSESPFLDQAGRFSLIFDKLRKD
jgi:transposase-like protein